MGISKIAGILHTKEFVWPTGYLHGSSSFEPVVQTTAWPL